MDFNLRVVGAILFIIIIQLQLIVVQAQQFDWGRAFKTNNNRFATAGGNSVAVGKNDDVFIGGIYSGQLKVDNILLNSINFDGFLIKLDSSGKTMWAHRMGATDAGHFSSVKADQQGDVYACGAFFGPDQANIFLVGNGILVKYSSEGNIEWKHIFPLRPLQRIVLDKNGHVYALGYEYYYGPDGGLQSLDVWLMKFDRTGKQLYNQLISRKSSSSALIGLNLAVDPWENVFISGLADRNALIGDIIYSHPETGFVLVKCNENGIPQWVKPIEDAPGGGTTIGEIISDGLGNIYYSTFGYGLSLSKYDPAGNQVWSIKRNDVRLSISKLSIDAYGNLLATGQAHGEFTYGKVRFTGRGMSSFVALFDNNGEIQWKLQGTNEQDNYLSSIDRSSATGNIYVTGILQSPSPSFGKVTLSDGSSLGRAVVLKVSEKGYKPLTLNLGGNTSLCPGKGLVLNANGFVWQEWQDGSQSSTYHVQIPGEYSVTALDFTGRQYFDKLRVEECFEATIPNIITPNGDGYNDYFEMRQLDTQLNNTLHIFNRWGGKVFSAQSYQNNWNAEGLNSDTYYYEIYNASTTRIYKGWIKVLR